MLKKLAKYFVFGNVWVSLNVLFFTYTTYLILGMKVDYIFLSFAFFSTLLAYNFQRVYKLSNLDKNSPRNQWLVAHKYGLYFLSMLGFLGTLISFLFLPSKVWLLVIVPSIISIFYVVPVNKQRESFRDLPFLKIHLIAVSWVFISVVIPLVVNTSFRWQMMFWLVLEKVLFVVALTIPFDVRDMNFDSPKKQTIPQVLGVRKSLYLASFFLVLSGGIAFLLFREGIYSQSIFLSLAGAYLVSIMVILQTKHTRSELFYVGLIDGLFIVQFALVWLGNLGRF